MSRIQTYKSFIKENNKVDSKLGIKKIEELIPTGKDLKYLSNKITHLFGYNKIKFLGNGQYGIAFKVIGEDKVIKLTTDKEEARIAEKLRSKNTKYITNYYDIRQIQFDGIDDKINLWAIVLDKVNPIPKDYFITYNAYLIYLHVALNIEGDVYNWKFDLDNTNYYIDKVKNWFKRDNLIFDEDFCLQMLYDMNNILFELHKYLNINSIHDVDLHAGNVGLRNNKLILFDVSLTRNNLEFKLKRKKFTI